MVEKKKLVLIVDDEPMIRLLLNQLLQMDGYSVEEAKDGADAVGKAKTLKPDIIVMDYMMPQLDGISACKEINETPETSDVPIIMLSANSKPELVKQSQEAGAELFLDKSNNIPTGLTDAIKKLLD
ncbi:MAG: response regulator [Chloroflexota bacterium]